jgi:UDP-N-acetylmuramate dehydrogenase
MKQNMDRALLRKIFGQVEADVRFDEPLARHTTWRIGGPADVFAVPHTLTQIQELAQCAHAWGVPWFVLGRGSNLLVRDAGVRGLVVQFGDHFAALQLSGMQLRAEAGRGMVSAAGLSVARGLAGLEFATGIPGSVGGAVTMNAGAHGGEIRDVLETVTVLRPDGQLEELWPEQLDFSYRHSGILERGYTVLAATFVLKPGDAQALREQVRAWSKRRQATQPLSQPNCGSVFRNPSGLYAAQLIEAVGLKGAQQGGAMVSPVHANFIVNTGGATAADVLALMARMQTEVRAAFAVELVPEVRVVGEEAVGR